MAKMWSIDGLAKDFLPQARPFLAEELLRLRHSLPTGGLAAEVGLGTEPRGTVLLQSTNPVPRRVYKHDQEPFQMLV